MKEKRVNSDTDPAGLERERTGYIAGVLAAPRIYSKVVMSILNKYTNRIDRLADVVSAGGVGEEGWL